MSENLSPCIGTYDKKDNTCIGGEDEPECGWKTRCRAFTRYLKKNKKEAGLYVYSKTIIDGDEEDVVGFARHGHDKFCEFCDSLVRAHRRKELPPESIDLRARGPKPVTLKASRLAKERFAKEHRASLMEEFSTFQRILVGNMTPREFGTAGNIVLPGQLYAVDRTNNVTSGYVAIYCRSAFGRDLALLRLKLRPRFVAFDAHFRISIEDMEKTLSKKNLARLKPKSIKAAGLYQSVIKGVKRRELALLAEIIPKWVDQGIIDLPEITC